MIIWVWFFYENLNFLNKVFDNCINEYLLLVEFEKVFYEIYVSFCE